MPSPSTSAATLRPDISESFEEFDLEMDREGYIAQKVMPPIEVQSQSGTFGKIPVEQLLKARDTARAPGSGYARSQFTFETASYACEEHGAEEVIDDRELNMYSGYFDAAMVSALRARSDVLRNCEQRVADAVFNATTFSSYTTGITNEWDDYTNAIPITDVDEATKAVYSQCGLWPNALIINYTVFRNLCNCDQIVNRIKYQNFMDARAGTINAQALAQVFNLDYVLVAGGSTNSANEGLTASVSHIWSNEYAMVAKVATTPDFKEPCLGRMFHWSEDGSQVNGTVEIYREESARGDVVRVRQDVDEIILYAASGHLLSNVTT